MLAKCIQATPWGAVGPSGRTHMSEPMSRLIKRKREGGVQ